MWLTFNSIEYKPNLVSPKTGKEYSAYIVKGMKQKFPMGSGEEEWQRTFFDTTTATIIEQGINRPNKSVVQFFQKAVRPGDKVEIKSEKAGAFWEIVSLENITNKGREVPTYEPLSPEELESIKNMTAPTIPAPPAAGSEADNLPPWIK